jgi:MULE transposase domain
MIKLRNLLAFERESRNLTFLSDRQKGLIDAIEEVFPAAPHAHCMRHLEENFRRTFKTPALVPLQGCTNIHIHKYEYEILPYSIYIHIREYEYENGKSYSYSFDLLAFEFVHEYSKQLSKIHFIFVSYSVIQTLFTVICALHRLTARNALQDMKINEFQHFGLSTAPASLFAAASTGTR